MRIQNSSQLKLLNEIAYARGAVVREINMEGAEARLSVMANQAIISVANSIQNHQRKRFSIAHELGHLEMHKAKTNLMICKKSDISGSSEFSASSQENEANQFASCLLMPTRFVKSAFEEGPSFEIIHNVAEEFDTSLTSTALRYLEFTKEPVAVVFTEDERIRWFQATKEFMDLGIFVEVKSRIDRRTIASYSFKGIEIGSGWKKVPAPIWLKEGDYKEDAVTSEWSVGMPMYNAVLSLLWIDDVIEKDDNYY